MNAPDDIEIEEDDIVYEEEPIVEDTRSPITKETGRRFFRAVEQVWTGMYAATNQLAGYPNEHTKEAIPPWDKAEPTTLQGWRRISLETGRLQGESYSALLEQAIASGGLVEVETREEWDSLGV